MPSKWDWEVTFEVCPMASLASVGIRYEIWAGEEETVLLSRSRFVGSGLSPDVPYSLS
jgi:hypothetical protein